MRFTICHWVALTVGKGRLGEGSVLGLDYILCLGFGLETDRRAGLPPQGKHVTAKWHQEQMCKTGVRDKLPSLD